MRIGIDLDCLEKDREYTGISNYALSLVSALLAIGDKHQWVLFGRKEPLAYFEKNHGKQVELVYLPSRKIPIWTAHLQYSRLIKKAKLDLFHGLANSVPLGYQGSSIITIHDLAIYKHPEWFPNKQWLSTKFIVPRSIKKSRIIIVPSQSTADDLEDLFRVDPAKISVIPMGVDQRFFGNNHHLPDCYSVTQKPFILFVGTIEPRKNLTRLVDAYVSLPEEIRQKYDLRLVGKLGWSYKDLLEQIANHNLQIGGKIKLVYYLAFDQLLDTYHHASIFVYPSLYEGFGLPVLEAMASGVPVITSRISSLPEISGPSFLINPDSVWQIGSAIRKVITDKEYVEEAVLSGKVWVKNFTWRKTAEQTLRVYERFM